MQLKYAACRHLIRTGDVAAFRGRRLFSRAIQFRTCSVFSHVGIFARIQYGTTERLCVIEALEGRGIQLLPASRILQRDGQLDWYYLNTRPAHGRYEVDREAVVKFAFEQWGGRYASPWQFVRSWGLLTRWILDRLGRDVDDDPTRFFCSELVAESLKAGGCDDPDIAVPAGCPPETISRLVCLNRQGVLVP